ncbi:MAG: pantetheine-phosphate adenylyltransferase [Clostridiaceae bacterium]
MRIAVYPGSFDPITMGHLDIIMRASKLFDKVIVGVLHNVEKKGLFTPEERCEMIEQLIEKYDNIEVKSFEGLLVDFMKKVDSKIIVKGLRIGIDFDYEIQMAQLNKELSKNDVETVLMMTNTKYSYISSSSVREILHFNGDIRGLVPDIIYDDIYKKVGRDGGKME